MFDIEDFHVPSSSAVASSAFGRITRTQAMDQAGPRTMQVSLRYVF